MHITLLCTTRGRVEALALLLKSLEHQTFKEFTLVLGLQQTMSQTEACTHSMNNLVQKYQKKFCIETKMLPLTSLSHARNLLIPFAQGDIVALTDDDCHYSPDCLEKVALFFAENPHAGALIGSDQPGQPAQISAETRYSLIKASPSYTLFFGKKCIHDVGMFDEELGIGAATPWQSGEETDYLLRAFELGFPVMRKRDILIYHPDVDVTHSAIYRKGYAYALGRMHLLAKHSFPFWFKVVNVFYPLYLLPAAVARKGVRSIPYSLSVFAGRFYGLLKTM